VTGVSEAKGGVPVFTLPLDFLATIRSRSMKIRHSLSSPDRQPVLELAEACIILDLSSRWPRPQAF